MSGGFLTVLIFKKKQYLNGASRLAISLAAVVSTSIQPQTLAQSRSPMLRPVNDEQWMDLSQRRQARHLNETGNLYGMFRERDFYLSPVRPGSGQMAAEHCSESTYVVHMSLSL